MTTKIRFISEFLRRLWDDYAARVTYARVYEEMLTDLGGNFVNDHIAFRTLALTANGHYLGVDNLKRVFDALDFEEKGAIEFSDTHLFARYVQHAEPDFPRIFISELKIDELAPEVAEAIRQSVSGYQQLFSDADVEALRRLDETGEIPAGLLEKTVRLFTQVPWGPVAESVIKRVNGASQYGAWVLLHGYNVNHFTGYVNRHGVDLVGDIESLIAELKKRGVPMKSDIEGARGSKLRQTSTEAVRVPVQVIGDDGKTKQIEWTYAYMEYAERGEVEENGKRVLFQGFLGPQAAGLFEMTRLK
ncbi:DUF1338 domain-containing protein [candidate division BRC1 bacterium HGW-BRC1-1]|jgi:hypothetical protein|nr:MAG: DUF1338 domain-containing protein [candidate division BRC1 bacterium HGW-BRC1-1]